MSVALVSLHVGPDRLPSMDGDAGAESRAEVWTLDEAAAYLRMSPSKLRGLARSGEVPGAFRLGKPWRFRADELRKLGKSPE
jgi:excisionase family DNA binding protein